MGPGFSQLYFKFRTRTSRRLSGARVAHIEVNKDFAETGKSSARNANDKCFPVRATGVAVTMASIRFGWLNKMGEVERPNTIECAEGS